MSTVRVTYRLSRPTTGEKNSPWEAAELSLEETVPEGHDSSEFAATLFVAVKMQVAAELNIETVEDNRITSLVPATPAPAERPFRTNKPKADWLSVAANAEQVLWKDKTYFVMRPFKGNGVSEKFPDLKAEDGDSVYFEDRDGNLTEAGEYFRTRILT